MPTFPNLLVDSQAREPEVVTQCSCCGQDIIEGYEHVWLEGNWFCDFICFMKFMGAETREAVKEELP
jgi:hypothetical protein